MIMQRLPVEREDLVFLLVILQGDTRPSANRLRDAAVQELANPQPVCCSTYEQYLEKHG